MTDHLKKIAESGKVSHAYIITGSVAGNRYDAAYDFAIKALDEQDQKGHPDLVELTHEKPGTISVDEIRSQVTDQLAIKPFRASRKVVIIDEAEKMTVQAQNALLKTIEEPPAYAVILLLTSAEQMLLETIRSRCITVRLSEEDDADESEQKAEFISILRGDKDAQFKDTEEIAAFLETARTYFRDILVEKKTTMFGGSRYSFEELGRILAAIDEAETRLKFNVNPELSIKLLMMEIKG